MIRRRRVPIVLLIAALALGACGLDSPPDAPALSDATVVSDPVAATTVPDSASGAEGVITIGFAAQEWERQVYEPLIATFNKENSDVRVQFVSLDEALNLGANQSFDPGEMTRRTVSAADTASSFFVRTEDINSGYLHDLKPLMEADATFHRDDFCPGALEQYSQGEGVYMVPRTLRVSLLSYNKDLWSRRGLPAPKLDWSWDDLIAAAEQLAQKRGDQVEVYGLVDWRGGFTMLNGELARTDANLFAMPTDQAHLDRPEVAAALERVVALVKSGAVYFNSSSSTSIDTPDAYRPLILEQHAGMWQPEMLFGGPNQDKPAFAVGTLPFPALPLPFFGGAEGYIMSSGTQHPEAAWRWLSFLSRQAINQPFQGPDSASQVPARKSVAEQSGYWKRLDDETSAAVQAVLARPAAPLPSGAFDGRLYDLLNKALASVVSGEQPVARALAEAQASLDQQIAQAQSTPSPTPASGPIVVATPAPNLAPEGARTITFGSLGFGPDQTRRIAREFNQQHPELFVQVQSTDTFSGPLRLADAAAKFDCFAWFGPPETDEYTLTLDLQPLIDADTAFKIDDYPPALLAPYRQAGDLHGLPYAVNFRMLAYNQDAFETAGLPPPRADWTLDDFISAAQQLTGGDGQNKRYGYATMGSQIDDLVFFIDRFGASLTTGSGDAQQLNFTDPKVVQAINAYLDLLRNSSPHEQLEGYTRDGSSGNAFQLISEGRVGMWFDSGYSFFFGVGERQSFTKMIAPPPLGAGPLSADDFSTRGLYISARTQQPEGCWTWLKYLSDDLSGLEGAFPARISLAKSEAFTKQALPGAAEVYQAYSEALQRSSSAGASRDSIFRSPIDFFWFFRAVDRALQGKDLMRELADAQATTEQFLTCVRGGAEGSVCAKQVDPSYNGWRNDER